MTDFLYITSDVVGTATGGGVVTRHESQALRSLGETEVWSLPGSTVWAGDQEALRRFRSRPDWRPKLAHFYSGTFSETIKLLKGRGCLVTYTAAAHDVEVSREEHRKLGWPFDYPHLNDPAQWSSYVCGYLDADAVVCPSTLSASVMRAHGCADGKIVVIPHGVEIPLVVAPPPVRFSAAYLGQPGADKGLIYLIKAWALLNYRDALLTIAGRGTEQLLGMVREHGGGNIQLLGAVDDVSSVYNACRVYVQPSACLVPGTLVCSQRGPVAIDKLEHTDTVLTDAGVFQKVIKPLRRQFSGELVQIHAGGRVVQMTPEHRVLIVPRGLDTRAQAFAAKEEAYRKILVLHREEGVGARRLSKMLGYPESTINAWIHAGARPEGRAANNSLREDVLLTKPRWVCAGEVEKGDVVLFPRLKTIVDLDSVELPQKMFGQSGNATKQLPDRLVLDDEVMQFFGYFVAEGCASKDGSDLIFCFNKSETAFAEDVDRVVKRLNLKSRIRPHKKKQSMTVATCSSLLWRFLVENFGRGAHNKTIPTWVLLLPDTKLIPFIRALWRGDGITSPNAIARRSLNYSTVSQLLAEQLFVALVRLGYKPKIHSSKQRGYEVWIHGDDVESFMLRVMGVSVSSKSGRRGAHTYIDENYYYVPIKKVFRIGYSGEVFNLEVEHDHCYCAPFVVHNSEGFGIEVLEAMAHGRPVICSAGAGACDVARFVVQSRSAQELAGAIDSYRVAPWRSAADGEAAREEAKKYTWPIIREKYVELWRSLL